MPENGVIVVGTDTGIGKTCVAAALLIALRRHGVDAVPMKPVQTGAENGRAPDLDFCLNAAGLECDAQRYDTLAPYRFPLAASPHLAARDAGVVIDPQKIVAAFRALRAEKRVPVIEAAGGVLVPLTETVLQIDVLRSFELPFILVARAGLGTLNHTLLTLEALRHRGARVLAVVMNQQATGDVLIEDDNERTLKAYHPELPVQRVPFLRDTSGSALETIGLALLKTADFQGLEGALERTSKGWKNGAAAGGA